MKILRQMWAMTGPAGYQDFKPGYWVTESMDGSIDAPQRLPGGSTVENVISGVDKDIDGRHIIGSLAWRA